MPHNRRYLQRSLLNGCWPSRQTPGLNEGSSEELRTRGFPSESSYQISTLASRPVWIKPRSWRLRSWTLSDVSRGLSLQATPALEKAISPKPCFSSDADTSTAAAILPLLICSRS